MNKTKWKTPDDVSEEEIESLDNPIFVDYEDRIGIYLDGVKLQVDDCEPRIGDLLASLMECDAHIMLREYEWWRCLDGKAKLFLKLETVEPY